MAYRLTIGKPGGGWQSKCYGKRDDDRQYENNRLKNSDINH